MKRLVIILTLFIYFSSYGQYKSFVTQLNDSCFITAIVVPFEPRDKRIEFSNGLPALIDGSPFFGVDGGMPTRELTNLSLTISSRTIELETKGMFDAHYKMSHNFGSYQLYGNYPLTSYERCRLVGSFSDGAGIYIAEWHISNEGSIRTIISNSEDIIFELLGH